MLRSLKTASFKTAFCEYIFAFPFSFLIFATTFKLPCFRYFGIFKNSKTLLKFIFFAFKSTSSGLNSSIFAKKFIFESNALPDPFTANLSIVPPAFPLKSIASFNFKLNVDKSFTFKE